MRQVVGAEREELRFLGNLICHNAGARQFDHGANQVVHFFPFFLEHFLGHAPDNGSLIGHFLHRANQRDHHLRVRLDAGLLHSDRRFENGSGLHLGNLRIGDSQPAAPMSQHRIELMQIFHPRQQRGKNLFQVACPVYAVFAIFLDQRLLLLCVGAG